YAAGQITVAVPHGLRGDTRIPDVAEDGPSVHGLETVTTSLILTPTQMLTEWPPERFEDVSPEHFDDVVALEPEVVIFGSGQRLRFPPSAISQRLTARGIGIEVMDTAAACRTFNILMAEGRQVVAALLMIETEED
ncbi:MAG: Mth938-like domain-containing protein, partial [Gammaproteobacteria bacterium]